MSDSPNCSVQKYGRCTSAGASAPSSNVVAATFACSIALFHNGIPTW
ncbi:hypothetical protein ABLE92_21580 [Gordonia sp. VNQ95]